MISLILLLIAYFVRQSVQLGTQQHHKSFCYDNVTCGPTTWGGMCQTGMRQSPIDIPNNLSLWDNPSHVKLALNGAHAVDRYFVINNGHTLKITLENEQSSSVKIDGYGLPTTYIFAQMHLHWGLSDNVGSEHTIGSKAFAMEVHLVYYSSKFKEFKKAAESEDPLALAVIGRFVTVVKEGKMKKCTAEMWDTITNNFPKTYNADPMEVKKKLDLKTFMPKSKSKFYRYSGSLTTPPCSESVRWTVFRAPLPAYEKHVKAFRQLLGDDKKPIGANYRPIQQLNSRIIEHLILD